MEKKVYEYISSQNNDPIIEWKICAKSGEEFPIFASEQKFFAQMSPTFA